MSESWIDRSWKDVINENLDDAISFFMPGLAAERDYSVKPEAADPERPAIGGKSNRGKRTPDLCISLPLAGGNASRAVFLIEQQHKHDKNLPLRMFQSYYRASDEYSFPVTSLAIYTGRAEPVDTYAREWQGTSVLFRYNIYSVDGSNAEELKRDSRNFALPALAAKMMLEAGGKALKRGAYSLELLDMIGERNLADEKAWSFRKFAHRLLQIDRDDIDPAVKEVWKMRFRPIDEVVRDIHMRDAREYGMAEGMECGMTKGTEQTKLDVARSMLADGVPAATIQKYTGLSEKSILSLR